MPCSVSPPTCGTLREGHDRCDRWGFVVHQHVQDVCYTPCECHAGFGQRVQVPRHVITLFSLPVARAMKQLHNSAFNFLRWRGRRVCSLTPCQQHASSQGSIGHRSAVSETSEDEPPSPIRYEHLAALVDSARSPRTGGPRQAGLPRADYHYAYRSTLRGWAHSLAGKIRYRDRLKGRHTDIDADYLLDLVLEQGGLCAYSGIPMQLLRPNSHWRVSIEREDISQGYLKGNCCLIAAEFNSSVCKTGENQQDSAGSAQWSKCKVEEVASVRTQQVQLQRLQEQIATARLRPSRATSPTARREPDAEGNWQCGHCGLWKPVEQFSKHAGGSGLQWCCKTCDAYRVSLYLRTLRGHALSLLCSARSRAAKGRFRGSFLIDIHDLLDMLWLQGGRCFYSGVPLRCASGPADWVWSIERLDNSATYTKENCVLIAREFQTPDQSRNKARFPVFGTAQWSRRKASHVWGPYFPEDGLNESMRPARLDFGELSEPFWQTAA